MGFPSRVKLFVRFFALLMCVGVHGVAGAFNQCTGTVSLVASPTAVNVSDYYTPNTYLANCDIVVSSSTSTSVVAVQIIQFDLNPASDYATVQLGLTAPKGPYTGSLQMAAQFLWTPNPLTLNVHFVATAGDHAGVLLKYWDACGNYQLPATYKTQYVDNYNPAGYGYTAGWNCNWDIQSVYPGALVRVEVTQISLYPTHSLYITTDGTSTSLTTTSGVQTPGALVYTGTRIQLSFYTDTSRSFYGHGFTFSYAAVPQGNACFEPVNYLSIMDNATESSYLAPNVYSASTDCAFVFTGMYLTSQIAIQFTQFSLDMTTDYVISDSADFFIVARSGDWNGNLKYLRTYSPQKYTLHFVALGTAPGIEFTHWDACGVNTMVASSTPYTVANYAEVGAGYTNSWDCSWTVNMEPGHAPGTMAKVEFVKLDLDSTDHFTISHGNIDFSLSTRAADFVPGTSYLGSTLHIRFVSVTASFGPPEGQGWVFTTVLVPPPTGANLCAGIIDYYPTIVPVTDSTYSSPNAYYATDVCTLRFNAKGPNSRMAIAFTQFNLNSNTDYVVGNANDFFATRRTGEWTTDSQATSLQAMHAYANSDTYQLSFMGLGTTPGIKFTYWDACGVNVLQADMRLNYITNYVTVGRGYLNGWDCDWTVVPSSTAPQGWRVKVEFTKLQLDPNDYFVITVDGVVVNSKFTSSAGDVSPTIGWQGSTINVHFHSVPASMPSYQGQGWVFSTVLVSPPETTTDTTTPDSTSTKTGTSTKTATSDTTSSTKTGSSTSTDTTTPDSTSTKTGASSTKTVTGNPTPTTDSSSTKTGLTSSSKSGTTSASASGGSTTSSGSSTKTGASSTSTTGSSGGVNADLKSPILNSAGNDKPSLTSAQKGGITGGVLGALVLIVLLILAILYLARRREEKRLSSLGNTGPSGEGTSATGASGSNLESGDGSHSTDESASSARHSGGGKSPSTAHTSAVLEGSVSSLSGSQAHAAHLRADPLDASTASVTNASQSAASSAGLRQRAGGAGSQSVASGGGGGGGAAGSLSRSQSATG